MNKGLRRALKKINHLTTDEDLRQDLWICYLTGTPHNSLLLSLETLEVKNTVENQFYELLSTPVIDKLLDNFSELELSIIVLLAQGRDIITIARYKGIAEVRVRQLITSIQSSKMWDDDQWHSSDTFQTKKNSV